MIRSLNFCLFFLSVSIAISADLPIKILEGKKSITIPFEYVEGYLVLEVEINDEESVSMIFDTGANSTLIFDKTYANQLGVSMTDTICVIGSDLRLIREAYVCREISIKLESSIPINHDILFLSEDVDLLDKAIGRKISGIIGTSFFYNLAIELDYRHGRLKVIDPSYIERYANTYDCHQELIMTKGKPHITYVSHDDSISSALLDTGSPLPYVTYLKSFDELPDYWITGVLGQGIGGPIKGYLGLEDKITLFNQSFSKTMTRYQYVQDLDSISVLNIAYRDGIIGNDLLSQFDILIDFMNRKIHTKTNLSYKKKFRYNKSGLQIIASGENLTEYKVVAVNMSSPAQFAGIKEEDQILACNLLIGPTLSLRGMTRIFTSKRNRKVKLKIQRDGKILKKEFVIKQYLG